MSYSDLYPERRGHEVSPSVLQRATGAGHPHSLKTQCERNVAHCVLNMPMVQVQYSTIQYSTMHYRLSEDGGDVFGVAGPVAQHCDGLEQPEDDQVSGQGGPGGQHPQCRGRGAWPHRARHPREWNSGLQTSDIQYSPSIKDLGYQGYPTSSPWCGDSPASCSHLHPLPASWPQHWSSDVSNLQ